MTTAADRSALLDALGVLREQLVESRLPLDVPGVRDVRTVQGTLLAQLDDYVLPRLRKIDAPLLAVVGGSTGAGKSTLVNSVVGEQVSEPGVLRPTTRSPVLVANPADERWFTDQRVLPSLPRVTGQPPAVREDNAALHVVLEDALPRGLALLDAPDIDSVVTDNRRLAAQLLAAADLWLFVTTAARYADAVPWDLLRTAQERSTAVAVVLDRVPKYAVDEVVSHLAQMLSAQGLGDAPVFVVPETTLDHGLLPSEAIDEIRRWLHGLASDAAARQAVVRQTLDGALRSVRGRVLTVAAGLDKQERAVQSLRDEVTAAYDHAIQVVDEGLSDGTLLRGEVLARWQEFVGTGELMRSLEAQVGRLRDRLAAAVRGRPAPGADLQVALETGVESLVVASADDAAARSYAAWRLDAAGRTLLRATGVDHLDRSSVELGERTARLVRDWQGEVLDLVRREGASKRTSARFLSFGVNGVGLLVMVAVFASTGGLTGTEVLVAGGAGALSQKLLEAVFGDQAVRRLADDARAALRRRVEGLLADEADRYLAMLEVAGVEPGAGAALRRAAEDVERKR